MTTDRQATYEAVLSVVGHHTDTDAPSVSTRAVRTVAASYGKHSADQVSTAILAAVDNGDLVRVGAGRVAPAAVDTLRAVIDGEVNGDGETDRNVVAKCNAATEELK